MSSGRSETSANEQHVKHTLKRYTCEGRDEKKQKEGVGESAWSAS